MGHMSRSLRSAAFWFWVVITVILCIVLAYALDPSQNWWYTRFLPWMEPVSTALAFIAASVATSFAYNAYRLEVKRDEGRAFADIRAQASLVAAWPVVFNSDGSGDSGAAGYAIRNASELPVRDVRVTWFGGDADYPPTETHGEHPLIPPSEEPVYIKGGVIHQLKTGEIAVHGAELYSPGGGASLIRLQFRDSANILWERDREGRLRKLSK